MALKAANLSSVNHHTRQAASMLTTLGYKILQDDQGRYYVVPPDKRVGIDPPNFADGEAPKRFPKKKPNSQTYQKDWFNNPIPADLQALENKLDGLVQDEMDFDQMDERWRAYVYGPAQRALGSKWTDMKEAGCGPATMAALIRFMQAKYGVEPAKSSRTGDEQTQEILDMADWLASTPARVQGGGTLQSRIDKVYDKSGKEVGTTNRFSMMFPGFRLRNLERPDALAHLKQDEILIFNGIVDAYSDPPLKKDQRPDKNNPAFGFHYPGHNILLWCLETTKAGFDIVRIFDPGGAYKFVIADQLDQGEFWSIERDTQQQPVNDGKGSLWLNQEGNVVHPDAPAGSGGPGFFRLPGALDADFLSDDLPHPRSPAARAFDPLFIWDIRNNRGEA